MKKKEETDLCSMDFLGTSLQINYISHVTVPYLSYVKLCYKCICVENNWKHGFKLSKTHARKMNGIVNVPYTDAKRIKTGKKKILLAS